MMSIEYPPLHLPPEATAPALMATPCDNACDVCLSGAVRCGLHLAIAPSCPLRGSVGALG